MTHPSHAVRRTRVGSAAGRPLALPIESPRGRPTGLRHVPAAGCLLALALVLSPAPAAAQADERPAHRATEGASEGSAAREGGSNLETAEDTDPRVGLGAGWMDAEQAIHNLELVAAVPRPEGFYNPESPGDFPYANTDLAFQGDHAFVGSYNGFQVWDISDPARPRLRVGVVCPGGQGDVSVFGDLLFMSVEETRGRIDCGAEGVADTASHERFRGVRIFDIGQLEAPRQVAAVQTCRGSHTHTLVTDPEDDEHIYVYVSGTSRVRPASELEGCSGLPPEEDPRTSLFRIEVIRVPVAAPGEARVVSEPRIFAAEETGDIAGLWPGGDHGEGTQRTARTNQCHDITAYPALGLAAGACSGNGILLDISDPANPVRLDEVTDPNFAYWHSATFSDDGTKVIFTDEWGGGLAPRCQADDPEHWGANAIFEIVDGRLEPAGYYKLPAPQTETENCVAHNGSLVPVPGRDIKVQAWYQGGISVFDFTDPAHPVEIAFFDRGPLSAERLTLGGHWSAYWYNGHIFGSEIARGLDVLRLLPSEHLTENEIEAARLARFEEFNAQHQPRLSWPPSFAVARAYLDQLQRGEAIDLERAVGLRDALDRAQTLPEGRERSATLDRLDRMAGGLDADAYQAEARRAGTRRSDAGEPPAGRGGDPDRLRALAGAIRELTASLR